MLRKSVIATLLVTASLPAWAFELKPGLWEQTIESNALGGETPQEMTDQQCITEEEAKDPEAAFRSDFNEAGFTDIEFTQSGNTVHASASNSYGGQDVEINITITQHSEEHTTSKTELISSETITTTQENRWIAEDC